MSSELCVYWSNSKDNYQLSNFYQVNIAVGEHLYPSVEHAFQAMQHETPEPWTVNGAFSDWEYVLARVNEARKAPITAKNLKKKNMIGALAKMVADRPLMFRLEPKPLADPYSEEVWMPLFEAKYVGKDLDKLLKTSGQLVRHDPNANEGTIIAARWDRVFGKLVGQNKMGQMLTKFRDSKRPKRKAEVIEGETLTFQEALNKKFKEAHDKGMVIELDQDEFLPHDWGDFTDEQKLSHAMEKNWTLQQCAKYIHMPNEPMYTPSSSSKSMIFSDSSDSHYSLPVPQAPEALTTDQIKAGLQSTSGMVLTWSHSVESGNYVNPIGTKGKGFTYMDLDTLRQFLNKRKFRTQMFRVQGPTHFQGHVLVVRNFIRQDQRQRMIDEINALPNFDTKGWFRGKCLNKSRWNTLLTDRDVQGSVHEPDKALRKSSENSFEKTPECKDIRRILSTWTSMNLDTENLMAEANVYGITKAGGKAPKVAPGIGPHVDGETVIATNLVGQRLLCLGAYHNTMPTGPRTQITINPGDMYIFDTTAAGTSIRGRHIRHWASGGRGDIAYIARLEKELVKKVNAMKAPLSEAAQFIQENKYQDTQTLEI